MSKVIGFKAIIKNMVESKIHDMVWKQADKVADVEGVEFDLSDKELGHPTFTATVEVNWHKYIIHGYVDTYGTIRVCSITYHRMVCQRKDEHGDWITESAKPVTKFVYGDALKGFKFDD